MFDPALRGGGHPSAPGWGARTHGVNHFQRTEGWVGHPGDYEAGVGTDDNVVALAAAVDVDDGIGVVVDAAVASVDDCAGGGRTNL